MGIYYHLERYRTIKEKLEKNKKLEYSEKLTLQWLLEKEMKNEEKRINQEFASLIEKGYPL